MKTIPLFIPLTLFTSKPYLQYSISKVLRLPTVENNATCLDYQIYQSYTLKANQSLITAHLRTYLYFKNPYFHYHILQLIYTFIVNLFVAIRVDLLKKQLLDFLVGDFGDSV